MITEVLGTDNIGKWKHFYQMLPEKSQDIFISPDYFIHCQDNGNGKSMCLVLQEGPSLYYFPFLIVPVKDPEFKEFSEYTDIQGPYGYNGIFAVNPTPEITSYFNDLIDQFAIESGAITAFLRCNPVYMNHIYFDSKYVHYQHENVILNLHQEDIFNNSYEYSTRKNIRKAEREGITVKYYKGEDLSDKQLNEFLSVYNATMDRNKAEAFYYFSIQYFRLLLKNLKNSAVVFFAYKDSITVSVELILLNSFVGYSFLGGTLQDYYPYRPNDYLKHHIINFLKEYGCEYYCLGGGPEGVVRFKKTFAKNGGRDFLVYKKVFFPDVYNAINQKWASTYPEKVERFGIYFQKYRF